MKKIFLPLFLAALMLPAISAFASDTSPYYFLRNTKSARGAALAGCLVSMKNDASAIFFNPASIYTVEEKRFSFTYHKHVLDINSGNAIYIKKLEEDKGVLGASLSYFNYGSFEYVDADGVKSGNSFSANDFSLGATYSNDLDTNLFYGVTAKFVFINLEEANSVALAFDAGLFYKMPDGRSNVGLSILHSGFQLSQINGYSDKLPIDLRAGINHRLRGLPLLVNFTFHHLADDSDDFFSRLSNLSIGGELYLGDYIRARLGYDNHVRRLTSPDQDKKLAGFTGGAGILTENFNIDYGVAIYGASAAQHRFSVSLDLD